MKKTHKLILVNLILLGIIFALVESGARVFIYLTRGTSTAGQPERLQYLSYRPFVMFGPDFDVRLDESRQSAGDDAFRVLLVGGSTAAGFGEHILESALTEAYRGCRVDVINAASGGYNARQELIVASIWGPDLQPDMLLSLDGANDLTHRLRMTEAGTFFLNVGYESLFKRPLLSWLVHILRSSQFVYGVQRLGQRRSVGPIESYVDAIPVFVSAQHSLNVLARGLSATRMMVLQPHMSFKRPLSDAEAGFTNYAYREQVVKALYNLTHTELGALAASDDVLYLDARPIFDGIGETVFSDDVHFVDDRGYEILARHIARTGDIVRPNHPACSSQ